MGLGQAPGSPGCWHEGHSLRTQYQAPHEGQSSRDNVYGVETLPLNPPYIMGLRWVELLSRKRSRELMELALGARSCDQIRERLRYPKH